MACNHSKQRCSVALVCLGRCFPQHTLSLHMKSNQKGNPDAVADARSSQTETNHVSPPITLLPEATVLNITTEEHMISNTHHLDSELHVKLIHTSSSLGNRGCSGSVDESIYVAM